MLLRGLLRLHRHQVLFEGDRIDLLGKIPQNASDSVLILDVNIGEEPWARAISQALRDHPRLRIVLLTPSRGGRLEEDAKRLGIQSLLRRPFAVHELVDAVAGRAGAVGPSAPPPS
jgi:DNA-binding NarL/FixJ family response regulator